MVSGLPGWSKQSYFYSKGNDSLSIPRLERNGLQLLPWMALDVQHFIYPTQNDGKGAGFAHMLNALDEPECCS